MGRAYAIDPETGERELIVEWEEPEPIFFEDFLNSKEVQDQICIEIAEYVDMEIIDNFYGGLPIIGQK